MMRILVAMLLLCGVARGQAPSPAPATYALFRLDPLGIPPEIVEQLERILRVELARVVAQALPSTAAVEKVIAKNSKLAGCTADPTCLKPLAKALGANRVVAGNVGGLAGSYVVNLKLVDGEGRELRRITATLRGEQQELIDEIRVATYRLVAPERMVGAIAVLAETPGATVAVDGRPVGQTPLAGPIAGLSVGMHQLTVERDGFSGFAETVPVRFEKTTQVVVRQKALSEAAKRAERRRTGGGMPVYTRWYFWTGMAVLAVATGVAIGFAIPKSQEPVDCTQPGSCQP